MFVCSIFKFSTICRYVRGDRLVRLSLAPATHFFDINNIPNHLFRRLHKIVESYCLSVRLSACNNSALIGRIFMKFSIWIFFESLSRKFEFRWNRTRIKCILHEYRCTFFNHVFLTLYYNEKYYRQICREHQNTHFTFSNFFENRAVYELMWKNILQPDRPQMTIWYTPISCWVPKATNAHSECVILIGFPLQ
jgi:hypothetical protein